MAPKGRMLGFDIDDAAYVPVATTMRMFNLDELMEIDVLFTHEGMSEQVAERVRRLLADRHSGREDVTITTQTEMLRVFDNIMRAITNAVAAIAAVSLVVGAIGVFTMMWIAVGERVSEIGLLRALGATAREVHGLFLLEAVVLTVIGGAAGIVGGFGIALAVRLLVPNLPVYTPLKYVLAALVVSALAGLAAGVLPARRAASLEPVDALRSE
jgi:putative ABC transport system permease protein